MDRETTEAAGGDEAHRPARPTLTGVQADVLDSLPIRDGLAR